MSGGVGERKPLMSRILSVQHFAGEQHVDSGWPLWLSSVAAEAIKGWMPRRADSFEKLDQVSFKISLLHAPFYFKMVQLIYLQVNVVCADWTRGL